MHKPYLALTIGPIYKTLQKAKNTQSLWGASYLFSYLMKEICINLKTKYETNFVIPYIKDVRIFEAYQGAGLFPDRLIIENGEIKDLEIAINKAIKSLVIERQSVEAINAEITEHNRLYKKSISMTNAEELKSFLYNYLLLGAVSIEVEEGKNVIDECGNALSILELQAPYYNQEKTDFLYFLIQNISETKLIEDAFGDEKYRFPSIPEISTAEFEKKYPTEYKDKIQTLLIETGKRFRKRKEEKQKVEDDEDKTFEKLKEIEGVKKSFRRYHKYIAIVKADGDNMGKAVTAIYGKDASQVEEIDKAILEFNLNAVETISNYGGKSIYLGGDDLLFFAPVCSQNENIFQLVNKLSSSYDNLVGAVFNKLGIQLEAKPTLSFGISITYNKYPMNEALMLAGKLLDEAKEQPKNAVAFQVMKHSGQYFGTRFPQDKSYYKTNFYELLQNTKFDNEDAFLSSVMYRIREMEYLIKVILEDENSKVRLENFFDNNFNEAVHSVKRAFLIKVADFIYQTFSETKNVELTLKTVYSTLRFIQFIHQKDSENDN